MKSDFLDALTNAEKQVRDYQSKLEELNENFSKAGRFSLKRIYNMPITFVLHLCNSYKNEEKKMIFRSFMKGNNKFHEITVNSF